MIALVNQHYGVQRIRKDDVFSVRDEHVKLLKAFGRVKDVPAVKAMSTENTTELVPVERAHFDFRKVEEKHESPDQIETIPSGQSDEDHRNDESTLIEQTSEYSRMLRDRATSLGIRVDGRWSDARVQREIDEHNKRTYQHMDMRATE
jgi:hypothetical protein